MVALFEKIHQLDVELLFEVACQSFSLVHSLFEQLNQLEDWSWLTFRLFFSFISVVGISWESKRRNTSLPHRWWSRSVDVWWLESMHLTRCLLLSLCSERCSSSWIESVDEPSTEGRRRSLFTETCHPMSTICSAWIWEECLVHGHEIDRTRRESVQPEISPVRWTKEIVQLTEEREQGCFVLCWQPTNAFGEKISRERDEAEGWPLLRAWMSRCQRVASVGDSFWSGAHRADVEYLSVR